MDADLQPGTRLSIDGLSRDLEVSPTPVREALFVARQKGWSSGGGTPGTPWVRYSIARAPRLL